MLEAHPGVEVIEPAKRVDVGPDRAAVRGETEHGVEVGDAIRRLDFAEKRALPLDLRGERLRLPPVGQDAAVQPNRYRHGSGMEQQLA